MAYHFNEEGYVEEDRYFIAGFEPTSRGKQLWTFRATNLLAAELAADMFRQRGFNGVTLRQL
jgi:hypothetical protein